MPELGEIERVEDLRKIWPNEARNFTVWLAQNENLTMLEETVGMEMEFFRKMEKEQEEVSV